MTTFLKIDPYGNIQEVFLGVCVCDCGTELAYNEFHIHLQEEDKERAYIRAFMRKWRQEQRDKQHD